MLICFSRRSIANVSSPDYGLLTAINGKLPQDDSGSLNREMQVRSTNTGLAPAELLLCWAYHRIHGILVTSTSSADRAARLVDLFSDSGHVLPEDIFDGIEQAAKTDGYENKIFYAHAHMHKADHA